MAVKGAVKAAVKQRLYDLLEGGDRATASQRTVDCFIGLLIVTNVLAVALESVPRFQAQYGDAFAGFEILSLSVFFG